MAGLAHDQEREVLPGRLPKPVDELLGRHLQLEARSALAVRLLLEPVARDGGEGRGLAVGQAQGYREVGVAVVVKGDDLLTSLRQDTRERASHGGLTGAAFSANRDFHAFDEQRTALRPGTLQARGVGAVTVDDGLEHTFNVCTYVLCYRV